MYSQEINPLPKSVHVLVLCHTVFELKSTLNVLPLYHVPFPPALSEDNATSTFITPAVASNAVPVITVCVPFM